MKDITPDLIRIREKVLYVRPTAEPRYAIETLQECVIELCGLLARISQSLNAK